jgi:hypothetical protein
VFSVIQIKIETVKETQMPHEAREEAIKFKSKHGYNAISLGTKKLYHFFKYSY